MASRDCSLCCTSVGNAELRALGPTGKIHVTIKINPSTFIFGVELLKYSCMGICL